LYHGGFPEIVPSTVIGKKAPSNWINIGQIGFGRIAMTHDLAETLKYDEARVVAVADLDSHRAAKGKQFKVTGSACLIRNTLKK